MRTAQEEPFRTTVMLKLTPMPNEAGNYILSVWEVAFWPFVLGTMVESSLSKTWFMIYIGSTLKTVNDILEENYSEEDKQTQIIVTAVVGATLGAIAIFLAVYMGCRVKKWMNELQKDVQEEERAEVQRKSMRHIPSNHLNIADFHTSDAGKDFLDKRDGENRVQKHQTTKHRTHPRTAELRDSNSPSRDQRGRNSSGTIVRPAPSWPVMGARNSSGTSNKSNLTADSAESKMSERSTESENREALKPRPGHLGMGNESGLQQESNTLD